jgi:hypothetical protein
MSNCCHPKPKCPPPLGALALKKVAGFNSSDCPSALDPSTVGAILTQGTYGAIWASPCVEYTETATLDFVLGVDESNCKHRLANGDSGQVLGINGDGLVAYISQTPNTFSSLGAGEPVLAGLVGIDAQFKTLLSANANLAITSTADEVTFTVANNLTSYKITDTSYVDAQFGDDLTAQIQTYAFQFKTIAASIAAGTPTVIVNSGGYAENIVFTDLTRNLFANGYVELAGTIDAGPTSHPVYIRGFRIQGKVTVNAFRICVFTNCHFVNASASDSFLDIGANGSVTFENCIFEHQFDVPIVNFLDNPVSGVPNQVIFSGCKIASLNGGVDTSYIATGPASGTNCSVGVLSSLYSNWAGTGFQNLAGLIQRPATLISATGLVVTSDEFWI